MVKFGTIIKCPYAWLNLTDAAADQCTSVTTWKRERMEGGVGTSTVPFAQFGECGAMFLFGRQLEKLKPSRSYLHFTSI